MKHCDDMHQRIEYADGPCPLCEAQATISRLTCACQIYREQINEVLDKYAQSLRNIEGTLNANHAETTRPQTA